MKKHTLYVSGTHCASCKIIIEDVIGEQPGVHSVTVNLIEQTLYVEGDIADAPQELIEAWKSLLEPHNYSLSHEKEIKKQDYKSVIYALPLGLLILGIFFMLQRGGLVNFGFEGGLTPWTALLVGLIASLSTCLAVVGGLVLSISAKVSQDVSTSRPFVFFHLGRLLSFMILGGILGVAGSAISINNTVSAGLGLFSAFIMIILGFNLLDIFRGTKRFQFTMPRKIFDKITRIENGFFAPFILGAGTFFLPCGFTQAMQIAALSSGSFWLGSMIMTMFAFGTLPVLSLLSFGSFKFANSRYSQLFYKTSGIVVLGLGVFAFLAGLAGLGVIPPLFNI